jgi:hypothetical protein
MYFDAQCETEFVDDKSDADFYAVVYALLLIVFLSLLAVCPDVTLAFDRQSVQTDKAPLSKPRLHWL